jgi:hypothetical protein
MLRFIVIMVALMPAAATLGASPTIHVRPMSPDIRGIIEIAGSHSAPPKCGSGASC